MPLDKDGKPILYKPWKNDTKSKFKYFVYVKSDNKKGFKKIGFGYKGMGQFKDKGGHYKSLDHGDKKRQQYCAQNGRGMLIHNDQAMARSNHRQDHISPSIVLIA